MSGTQKGHADYYDNSSWNAACFECGRKFKGSELFRNWQGYWVCAEHWEPRQPQDFVRGIKENIAPPFVQTQTDIYPLEVENVNTSTALVELFINLTAGAEPLIVNVPEGVIVNVLRVSQSTDGVAASGLQINNYGTILDFQNPDNLPVAASGTSVTPGVAVELAFTVQPQNGLENITLDAVEIAVLDANGDVVDDYTGTVALTLSSNPSALGGTTSKALTAGEVGFDDLTVNTAGDGYTLTAELGDFSVVSNAFDVEQTYTKQYTLLHTTTNGRFVLPNNGVTSTFYNGVVQTTNFVSGGYTATELYNFTSSNTPLNTSTGMSPERIFVGRYQSRATPPGNGIYFNSGGSTAIYLRDNSTGTFQTITTASIGTTGVTGYSEESGEFLFSNGNSLIAYGALNWAAGTYVNNSGSYTPPYSLDMARNCCQVPQRCYVGKNTAGIGEYGWFDTVSKAYTTLATYDTTTGSPLVFSPTYTGADAKIAIQRGNSGQYNYIDIWDTAGNLVDAIQIATEPSGVSSWYGYSYDYINNYLWFQVSNTRLYVVDLTTSSVVDLYTISDLPGQVFILGPVGSPSGGVYAMGLDIFGENKNIYKIG